MCRVCEYWLGFKPEHSYTGCSLGFDVFEISHFYIDGEYVKRETGLDRGCKFFKHIVSDSPAIARNPTLSE